MHIKNENILICIRNDVSQQLIFEHFHRLGYRHIRFYLPGENLAEGFIPDKVFIDGRYEIGEKEALQASISESVGGVDISYDRLPGFFKSYPAPAQISTFKKVLHEELYRSAINVELELTTRCNTQCIFCPRTKLKRINKNMDLRLLEWILNHIEQIKPDLVWLCGVGEPLLFPRIIEIVERLSRVCRVGLNTNGLLLNQLILRRLLDAGLCALTVSMHGFSKDVFNLHAGPINRSRVYENVKRALALCPEIVSLQTVATTANCHEIQNLISYWYKWGARRFQISQCSNKSGHFSDCSELWYGDIDKLLSNIANLKLNAITAINDFVLNGSQENCTYPIGMIFVTVTGHILHCQHDFAGDTIKGFFPDYDSDALRKLRMDSYLNQNSICNSCNSTDYDHGHVIWKNRELVPL